MPSNLITLHVGQCGNQIGDAFWKTMCEEHGIGPTGQLIMEDKREDQKEMLFYESELGSRYVPRSVLIDLEPRVIHQIISSDYGQLHNKENIFQSKSGGGAGNNWAAGFNQSNEVVESVFDILDREAENAEFLEGFVLCHSISGGTGSGLGSKMLEQIKERYPKAILQTFSVFSKDNSEVVVGPYNSMLTLQWLIDNPDFVVVLDNQALYNVATDIMRVQAPSFQHINTMISRIMSSVTSPMRFYSPVYTRLSHMAAYLNPFPPMQFIQTAYAPFCPDDSQFIMNTSPSKLLNRVLDPRSLISSARKQQWKDANKHSMLSALAVLRSDAANNITEVDVGGMRRGSKSNAINYPPWSSSTLNVTCTKLSPYVEHRHHNSALLLANHTNIAGVLQQTAQQYDQLRSKRAFLSTYEKEDAVLKMDDSRQQVQELIDFYAEANKADFLQK